MRATLPCGDKGKGGVFAIPLEIIQVRKLAVIDSPVDSMVSPAIGNWLLDLKCQAGAPPMNRVPTSEYFTGVRN